MAREISFQDADFERKLILRSSAREGRSLRWTACGMPRLNSAFKRVVFFLYKRDFKTRKIGTNPVASGIIVGTQDRDARHLYAITCYHVAVTGGATVLRINTKDERSRLIELDHEDWQFIPQSDDIAAADISERIDPSKDEIAFLPISLFSTKDFLDRDEVEIGEDGFMLGLFADHPGKDRNLVAARFGNVSLLANEYEPIEQPNGIKRPSHLFDLRSRAGFSGSPVFIYRTPGGDLRQATQRGWHKELAKIFEQDRGRPDNVFVEQRNYLEREEIMRNTFLMFLGIHAGQYYDTVVTRKVKVAEADDAIRDGDKLRIPNSMTIVVPAWEVLNLLNFPIFVRQREDRVRSSRKENVAEPETTSEPESDDAELGHRDRFTALLNAAARKPESKD